MKSEDIVRVENSLRNEDAFTVRWNVTYLCNYNCKFCIQGNKDAHIIKSKEESKETREKICNNLINFIYTEINKKYKEIDIYLIGGEITILPDFLDIMTKLVECKFEGMMKIQITTNLSTDKKILNSLIELFNRKYKYQRILNVSASFYKEFTSEEEFISKVKLLVGKKNLKDKVIKKLFNSNKLYNKIRKILGKKLTNQGVRFIEKMKSINVAICYPLCTDEDYKDYIQFVKKYKNVAKKINYIIIRDYEKSISKELKRQIDKEYNRGGKIIITDKNDKKYYLTNINEIEKLLDGEKYFNPNGYLCNVGINTININNLGIVSRCSTCRNDTIIGNIKEGKIQLPKNKFVCTVNKCVCNYYSLIEKNNK